jgi:hypothetical protein
MRTPIIFAALAVCTPWAAAQPVQTHEPAQPTTPGQPPQASANQAAVQPNPFLEGFPPDSVAAPGLPGARSHPDVPEGYVLIQGDIQVRIDEYRDWLVGNAAFGSVTFWGLTVPFSFNANVTATDQQLAINAMNGISSRTGLTFVARTNQSDFIVFNDSTGNNSPVGRQGGSQTINILNWSNQFVITHELYHSLGFHHEQSRPDRDTFVTINFQNVCQDCCPGGSCDYAFEIRNILVYGPYDFDSFMHYPDTAFSINTQPTIVANPPFAQFQSSMGQRDHFSFFDEITCRGIYPEPLDYWWAPNTQGFGFGTFLNPFIHSSFGGAYNATPSGGTLFIKFNNSYPAVGTYARAMTLRAPLGARLGN